MAKRLGEELIDELARRGVPGRILGHKLHLGSIFHFRRHGEEREALAGAAVRERESGKEIRADLYTIARRRIADTIDDGLGATARHVRELGCDLQRRWHQAHGKLDLRRSRGRRPSQHTGALRSDAHARSSGFEIWNRFLSGIDFELRTRRAMAPR